MGANVVTSYYDDFREEWEGSRGLDWPAALGWNYRDGQPPLSARVRLRFRDPKGGDIQEFPDDLKVREHPNAPPE